MFERERLKKWIQDQSDTDWIGYKQQKKIVNHNTKEAKTAYYNYNNSLRSPHPTNNVGRVYPEFFRSFNFV